MASYDEEFKKRIVQMHPEDGQTIKSLFESTAFPRTGSGTGRKNTAKNTQKILLQRKNMTLRKKNLRLRKEHEKFKKTSF